MDPWHCALFIAGAGAVGGLLNALLTNKGFLLPHKESGVLCPGFLGTVLTGACASFVSWAAYGSGAGVELARKAIAGSPRAEISLTFGALAGAFLVGFGGARWITNEADKRLLKESAQVAAQGNVSPKECAEALRANPEQALQKMKELHDARRTQATTS